MFNFIFDGKIGDILAPVVPSNKLFLAIQHHKNDEVQQLILSSDVARNAEGGHGAVHVACRYNNRFALEMILSRGVPVETVDQSGNTPLHYACKYGHIDICRYLIELGASPCRKNSRNETPYDVAADHHVVRQYMLPLQFQAERTSGDTSYETSQLGISSNAHYASSQGYAQQYPAAPTVASYQQSAMVPPPVYGAPPAASYNVAPPPSASVDVAAGHTTPSPPPGVVSFAPPPSAPAAFPTATVPYNNAPRAAPTTTRIIQPDGFHSSASDPVLQKKYGHIKLDNNIAPPPTSFPAPGTAGPPPPGAYSAYPGAAHSAGTGGPPPGPAPGGNPYAGGGVYSRYVPYDVHTNAAAAPAAYAPPAQSSFPSFPGLSRPNTSLPTYAPAPAAPHAAPPAALPGPGRPPGGTSPNAPAAPAGVTPPSAGTPATANTSAPSSQRLLGNKGLSVGGEDLFQGNLVGLSSQSSGDGEREIVITASSTSSAVL